MRAFRPWGHLDWLLDRLGDARWSLLACCGIEARSVALAKYLGRLRLEHVDIVVVRDPDPYDESAVETYLGSQRGLLTECGFSNDEIHNADLLAGLDDFREPR